MKRLLVILLIVINVFVFTSCSKNDSNAASADNTGNTPADTSANTSDEKLVVRIATVISSEESPTLKALRQLEKDVETKTDKIDIQLFPAGQLGTDMESFDNVRGGGFEMTVLNPLVINTTLKDLAALDRYFLFDNEEHASRFFHGEGGQYVLDMFQQMETQGLGFFPLGFRELTNSKKPITSMDDMKGLKIRGYNPVQISVWEAAGCNLSSVSWNELFTAMQQKLIDGQECALTTVYDSKFYEVQKYLTLTNHLYSTDILVANKNFMDSLSPENAAVLNECLETAFANQYKMYTDNLNTITEELQSKYGVEISELSKEAKEAMVEKMAPVGEKAIVDICGQENLDKIKAFADAARK